jgi:hypothetical protein
LIALYSPSLPYHVYFPVLFSFSRFCSVLIYAAENKKPTATTQQNGRTPPSPASPPVNFTVSSLQPLSILTSAMINASQHTTDDSGDESDVSVTSGVGNESDSSQPGKVKKGTILRHTKLVLS